MTEQKQHDPRRQYYPALRGKFGDWIYYSCLMSMSEVTTRLSFADEVYKSEKLSEWIQRKLKSGRDQEISNYLQRESQRFFNSLVVAIYRGDPTWHGFSNFRPQNPDINLADVPDEVEDSVGFISFTGEERMFAVDGQHRLAGMKHAIKSDSKLAKDEVSLLVVAHHPEASTGRERTRRLFTTLNKTAKPVGKGDIIALDENDVMAIVTRHLVENHPWFSDRRIKFSQTDNIPQDAPELTTIGSLYDILTALFPKVIKGRKLMQLRFIRPDEKDLQKYEDVAKKFFKLLAQDFPPLLQYFKASAEHAPSVIRRWRTAKGGHVLFRPVGLRIFAELTAELVKQEGKSLNEALGILRKLPSDLAAVPYARVIWLPNGLMNPRARALCKRLLLYMVGRGKDIEALRRDYAKQLEKDEGKVHLPEPVV
jgi:DNA sulfur modification protein DndB